MALHDAPGFVSLPSGGWKNETPRQVVPLQIFSSLERFLSE